MREPEEPYAHAAAVAASCQSGAITETMHRCIGTGYQCVERRAREGEGKREKRGERQTTCVNLYDLVRALIFIARLYNPRCSGAS